MEQRIGIERMEEAVNLFGSFDENIRLLEAEFQVQAVNRGGEIVVSGEPENVMLAAVCSQGTTVVANAAREPEIADLAAYLNCTPGVLFPLRTGQARPAHRGAHRPGRLRQSGPQGRPGAGGPGPSSGLSGPLLRHPVPRRRGDLPQAGYPAHLRAQVSDQQALSPISA